MTICITSLSTNAGLCPSKTESRRISGPFLGLKPPTRQALNTHTPHLSQRLDAVVHVHVAQQHREAEEPLLLLDAMQDVVGVEQVVAGGRGATLSGLQGVRCGVQGSDKDTVYTATVVMK